MSAWHPPFKRVVRRQLSQKRRRIKGQEGLAPIIALARTLSGASGDCGGDQPRNRRREHCSTTAGGQAAIARPSYPIVTEGKMARPRGFEPLTPRSVV